MPNKKELAKKRFEIIRPFFEKEKKLKDIENESQVSYATLKRWVKSYKESGLDGLTKKVRVDKSQPKKLDDSSLSLIKKIYLENSSLSVSKLYNKFLSSIPSIAPNISYPTFHRIINNLDSFIKDSSQYHIKKIMDSGSIFGIYQRPILCPNNNLQNSIIYITIFFNVSDLSLINYSIESTKFSLKNLFPFIWESIVISQTYPKKIYLYEDIKEVSKKFLRDCFIKTSIEFIWEEFPISSLKEFCNHLETKLLKDFSNNKNIPLIDIKEYINRYFFHENSKINIQPCFLENFSNLRNLDFFLLSTKRKVYPYGIRFKNKIYTNEDLKSLIDEIVEIKYTPNFNNIIYIFYKNSFFCQGILEI
ncbi:Mu transposase C-terminal domain-containing protein [Cetobacterium sp. SF1]|uniref:Mu transposase C-terminal domain-containing protein n=1 Tax=unclassified Cetobacterium TaxID=2630983 RepID=UPI003CF4597D